MAGFLDRAKESAQRALSEGKHRMDDVQATRTGQDLLRKLGIAYYEQQRGHGSAETVQSAMDAVDEHIRIHGDTFLRHRAPQ